MLLLMHSDGIVIDLAKGNVLEVEDVKALISMKTFFSSLRVWYDEPTSKFWLAGDMMIHHKMNEQFNVTWLRTIGKSMRVVLNNRRKDVYEITDEQIRNMIKATQNTLNFINGRVAKVYNKLGIIELRESDIELVNKFVKKNMRSFEIGKELTKGEYILFGIYLIRVHNYKMRRMNGIMK